MTLKRFIYNTLILVLISTFLCVVIYQFFFPSKFLIIYAFLPAIFGFINVSIFRFLHTAKDQSLPKFSNRYMLCTTIKLFVSIIFIILFLILNRNQALFFLSTFFVVYIVFLTQEIVGILNFFKKNSKS